MTALPGKVISFFNSPPHIQETLFDERAEHLVLGAVLHKPELYDEIIEVLTAHDFGMVWHQAVWRSFDVLVEQNIPIDPLSVDGILESHQYSDEIRLAKLTSASHQWGDFANYRAHAETVRRYAQLRRLADAGGEIIRLATSAGATQQLSHIIDESNRLVFEATDKYARGDLSISAQAHQYLDMIDAQLDGGIPHGTTYGYVNMARLFGRHITGDVAVLSALSGQGKTTMALSIILNELFGGDWDLDRLIKRADEGEFDNAPFTVYFTMEMRGWEMCDVIGSMLAKLPRMGMRQTPLTSTQYRRLLAALSVVARLPIQFIDNYTKISPMQIRRKLRKIKRTREYRRIVIDGLWHMVDDVEDDGAKQSANSLASYYDRLMSSVIALARDEYLGAPTLALQQYVTEYQRKRRKTPPQLGDVAWGMQAIQQAQTCIGLYRESKMSPTRAYCLKHRADGSRVGEYVDFNYVSGHFEESNR